MVERLALGLRGGDLCGHNRRNVADPQGPVGHQMVAALCAARREHARIQPVARAAAGGPAPPPLRTGSRKLGGTSPRSRGALWADIATVTLWRVPAHGQVVMIVRGPTKALSVPTSAMPEEARDGCLIRGIHYHSELPHAARRSLAARRRTRDLPRGRGYDEAAPAGQTA